MTIESRLNLLANNVAGIKQALEDRGAEVGNAPLSQYPSIIEGLKGNGAFRVGKIALNKLNSEAPGWLPCDGSAYPIAAYPALGELIGESSDAPAGYFVVPDIPPNTYGDTAVQPMIKAEED